MSQKEVVRTVEATGTVKADFDSVGFSIAVQQNGDSGPRAKDLARPIVDNLQKVIKGLEEDHGVTIDEESRRLTFSIDPNIAWDGNQQVQNGYSANYSISFRTKDLAKASIIMDELTSVEGTQVSAPEFRHDDPSALYSQALQDAKLKAEKKFSDECHVLGISPRSFVLVSWNVQDGDRGVMHGKATSMALLSAEMSAGPVEVEVGRANISVTLYLSYAPQNSVSYLAMGSG